MRKKLFFVTGLSCFLLMGCVGCSKENEVKHVDAAEVTETSEASQGKKAGSKTVKPLPAMFAEEASDEMPDGGYAVSIKPDGVKKTKDGYAITMKFFDYDRYAKEEVDGLKKGDSIQVLGKNIKVETVEKMKGNSKTFFGLEINGGFEEDGVSLCLEDEEYRTTTLDDFPMYYSIGTGTVPVSKDLTVQDCCDYEKLPDGVITGYQEFPDSIVKNHGDYWTQCNTSIMVRNGEIVQIKRNWTP